MTRTNPLGKISSTTRVPHGPTSPGPVVQTPPHVPENCARSAGTSSAGAVIVVSIGSGVARVQSFASAALPRPSSIAARTAAPPIQRANGIMSQDAFAMSPSIDVHACICTRRRR